MDLEEAINRYVPDGFRDDDGVWHDGPHREAALAEYAALVALETAVRELLDIGGVDGLRARVLRAHVASVTAFRLAHADPPKPDPDLISVHGQGGGGGSGRADSSPGASASERKR